MNINDLKAFFFLNSKNCSTPESTLISSCKSYDSKKYPEFISEIETAILNASSPISLNESEEISVTGESGLWLNKKEALDWKGDIPLEAYKINHDPNPDVILKTTNKSVNYTQEIGIRYLKPPTPPAPGDIIINFEKTETENPAPPIIIRQIPSKPKTPEPIIFREAPPPPPKPIKKKVINICAKKLPPPPRKVIIERLAKLPQKPQPIIIERWLPYTPIKRKVILKTFDGKNANEKPKNLIIQWDTPEVKINRNMKYLGIVRANPEEYIRKYGNTLFQDENLPDFVKDIKKSSDIKLALESNLTECQLEGDIEALKLVDLDKEGLSQYKTQIEKFDKSSKTSTKSVNIENLNKLLNYIDNDGNGKICLDEVKNLFLFLNDYFRISNPIHIIESWINILDHDEDKNVKFSDVKKLYENFFFKNSYFESF